jgi:hypothetical protein
MFLLDSLLLAPGKAVIAMLEELAKKAQEEFLDDSSVKQELQEIYKLLEGGTISEKEFDAREVGLLQRLEQIAMAKLGGNWGTPPMELPPASVNGEIVDVDVEVTDMPVQQSVQTRETMREVERAASPGRLELATIVAGPPTEPRPAAPLAAPATPPPVLEPPFDSGQSRPFESAHSPTVLGMSLDASKGGDDPQRVEASNGQTAPLPPPIVPAALTMMQVIDSTTRQLAMLKLKISAITSVARADDGWRVTAEMLERRAVPDTSDLLGVYELQLDHAGNLLRYERTHMRRRCDLG